MAMRDARRRPLAAHRRACALVVISVFSACGGSNHAAPTAPSPPSLQLSVAVAVTNTKFGTAVASDFMLSVTGLPAPVSMAAADDGPVTIAIPTGNSYSVTATGPDGYDATRSAGCSGTSAAGARDCTIALKESPVQCDDSLWATVYMRDRLKVLDPCQAASGVVADVGLEPDGDLVIELVPDAPYAGLLRPGNRTDPSAHNHLIVEVPCQSSTSEAEPQRMCAQFRGTRVRPPVVGAHIVAAAHWVEDRNHSSWGELHGARLLTLPH